MAQTHILDELKHRVAQMDRVRASTSTISFGLSPIDDCLPGNGLAGGALHEFAGGPELADDSAATCFIAGLVAQTEGTILWCLRWQDLFAPSLCLVGLHPDRVIFVECGDDTGVLIAMEEGLRHAGLAAVVGELKKISTTASKRLQLAAEKSGVPAFIFRRWAKIANSVSGTAAASRWRIRAMPSEVMGIPALGRPRWKVDLERVRGGEPQSWIVEACDAQGRIALPAELANGQVSAEERQAAS